MQTTVCSRCKKPIFFATTEAGAAMPFDVEPDQRLGEWWIDDAGTCHHIPKAEREQMTLVDRKHFATHWASCPYSDQFRRTRP